MLASGEDGYKLSCSGTSPPYKKREKKKKSAGRYCDNQVDMFYRKSTKTACFSTVTRKCEGVIFFVLGALFGKPVTQKDILEC